MTHPEGSTPLVDPEDSPWAKDLRMTFFLVDIQAFYISQQKVEAPSGLGPGILRLALERAGRRLNLPFIVL